MDAKRKQKVKPSTRTWSSNAGTKGGTPGYFQLQGFPKAVCMEDVHSSGNSRKGKEDRLGEAATDRNYEDDYEDYVAVKRSTTVFN